MTSSARSVSSHVSATVHVRVLQHAERVCALQAPLKAAEATSSGITEQCTIANHSMGESTPTSSAVNRPVVPNADVTATVDAP